MRGIKQRELQKCIGCGLGVANNQQISFMVVTMQRFVLNVPAINRQAGLEQFFHGAPALASVMGPDEDLAKPVEDKPAKVFVCDRCAIEQRLFELYEKSAVTDAVSEGL